MSTPHAPRLSLGNVPSQHPQVVLSVREADLDAPEGCTPYLLVQLPPALFVDPYEYPPHRALAERPHDTKTELLTVARAHVAGQTELEKAVGWTDPLGKRRLIISRRAGRSGSQAGRAQLSHAHAVGSEASQVLLELRLQEPGKKPLLQDFNGTMEALLNLRPPPKLKARTRTPGELAREHTLTVPLHTRYLPPVPADASASANSALPDWRALLSKATDLKRGNYEHVELPEPHFFWSCAGEPSRDEAFKTGWEYIQPSSMLKSFWADYSLSPPLPSSTDAREHRLLAPMRGAGDALAAAAAAGGGGAQAWTVPVPRGDAALTTLTQLVTAATVLLTALYALLAARRALNAVERVEAPLRKRAEAKSQ